MGLEVSLLHHFRHLSHHIVRDVEAQRVGPAIIRTCRNPFPKVSIVALDSKFLLSRIIVVLRCQYQRFVCCVIDMNSLPDTVTVLHCLNGSTVYLVGTAHFSKESVRDVRETIRKVRPNVVVLELCGERQLMLQYSEEDILREAAEINFTKVRHYIRRDGLVAGVMQSLFLKLSAELTKKLGVAPGGEFRAAYEEGVKQGARIVLGDRLINVTFKRVLLSLNFFQKLRFYYTIGKTLSTDLTITPEEVEKMKNKDMVDMLVGELAKEFPTVTEVLVDERDKVLAYSLKHAALPTANFPMTPRMVIVGVVGMGHVKGIQSQWDKDITGIQELVSIPKQSRTARVLSLTIRLTVVGALGAAVYFTIRRFL